VIRREQQLARFLTGNETADGAKLLTEDIKSRMILLYGRADNHDPDEDPKHPLWRAMDNAERSRSEDKTLFDGYNRAVKQYRAGGGTKPTDCEMALLAEPDAGDPPNAVELYVQVIRRCKQLAAAQALEVRGALDPLTQKPVSIETVSPAHAAALQNAINRAEIAIKQTDTVQSLMNAAAVLVGTVQQAKAS
jgi:hypothetical protein